MTGSFPNELKSMMQAFRQFMGINDLMAYLTMMAIRLVELKRVLKSTGSIYLHCDPTASHYLKILMDQIFGVNNYRNEIVWVRTNAHNFKTKVFARANDSILWYTKGKNYTFNHVYAEYSEKQLGRYKEDENGRLYTGQDLTFTGTNQERQFEWRGSKPPSNRVWGASLEQLEKWWAEGRILKKKDGCPRLDGYKMYFDEAKGCLVTSCWTDLRAGRKYLHRTSWLSYTKTICPS